MSKYSDIEIHTAENLLENGYKWLVRYEIGRLFAHSEKPIKRDNLWGSAGNSVCVCKYVPIFQSIRSDDKEPVSLESIVHPQILNDAEKRYLKGVIGPFRDKVLSIKKSSGLYASQYFDEILVYYESFGHDLCFDLPPFEKGTMYIGMKSGREYTLEELGL